MPVVRLDLAYDGTDFHGYARQPDVRTVQGELEAALSRRLGPVQTVVAGRTDAGVHAAHQVVSFEVDPLPDVDRLVASLRKMLPSDIAVTSGAAAPDGFSARFSARSRTYRYVVETGPAPDPFWRRFRWHVPHALDVPVMDDAVRGLVGEHDFVSFCRRAPGRSTVRTVFAAGWERVEHGVEFEVTAKAFCHQMVRSIVAACVDVGRGKLDTGYVDELLAARDRSMGRGAAPPHGLTLLHVDV